MNSIQRLCGTESLYNVAETKDGGGEHVIASSIRKTKTNSKRERRTKDNQTNGKQKEDNVIT